MGKTRRTKKTMWTKRNLKRPLEILKYRTDNWYSAQRQARQKAAQEKQEANFNITKYKTMKYI